MLSNIFLNCLEKEKTTSVFYRFQKTFKKKNALYYYDQEFLEKCDDGFFDYAFCFCGEDNLKISVEDFLKYKNKFKYTFMLVNVKSFINSCDNITEKEILNLDIQSETLNLAKKISHNEDLLGFFYFNLVDNTNRDNSLFSQIFNKEKKEVIYEQDRIETFFHTKNLCEIIIQVMRKEERLKFIDNNFVNLAYSENYKISEIADFCNSKILFQNEFQNNFYGCGKKLQETFDTGRYFSLADALLYNQRK